MDQQARAMILSYVLVHEEVFFHTQMVEEVAKKVLALPPVYGQ
jgi:hypothetical protein